MKKKRISSPCVIEHIGSTAVEGLGGKGIIDIALTSTQEHLLSCKSELLHLGYLLSERRITQTSYFLKKLSTITTETLFHLHLVLDNSKEWKNFLFFRDYLRSHAEEVKRYEDIKKKACLHSDVDGIYYKSSKEIFFKEVFTTHLERR